MSYKGKSAAAGFIAITLVYGVYFVWDSLPGHTAAGSMSALIASVITLIAITTVLEIILALGRGTGRRADERDALNSARGARNSFYALLAALWLTPVIALWNPSVLAHGGVARSLIADVILGLTVLAELVSLGSRVVYDLRGA